MRVLGVVSLVLLCAAPAAAAPFTWLVQGTVTNLVAGAPAGPFASALHAGDSINWWLTLDSAAPDYDASADCGQYTPILSMAFQDGPVALSEAGMPGQDYLVKSSAYSAASMCATFVPPLPNTARIRAGFGAGLMVSLHLAGAFASDALPVDASAVTAIGTLDFFYAGFNNPIASARVTAIRNVPEPAAAVLLMGGLAAIRRRRRGSRRSALGARRSTFSS